jgi:translation initiation factor 4A
MSNEPQNENKNEISTTANTESTTPDTINSWDELECKTDVLRGIYAYGFENPSPIQKQGILPLIQGKDIIAQAQSGTGKTGCFVIGALELIDDSEKGPQIIIIAPTRELSQQIKKVVDSIGSLMSNLKTELLIGGVSSENNAKSLRESPQIVIGCPGRVYDMIQRKHLSTQYIKTIIIDEADEMLSPGFKEQIYNIFQKLPSNVQVALFSATMPNEIYNLTGKFMRDPVKILVKTEMLTLDGIGQYYINLTDDTEKYDTLKDLFSVISVSQCIIYCNSVNRVSDLYDAMSRDNFPVCRIHSNMDKEERHKNYNDFINGTFRVLISSNLTARGIDIQQVSTVINFDIPSCVNTYLHRIGRSGRWGRKGTGINFVTKRDFKRLKEIETFYNTEINELPADFNQGA